MIKKTVLAIATGFAAAAMVAFVHARHAPLDSADAEGGAMPASSRLGSLEFAKSFPGGRRWSRYIPNVTLTTHEGEKVRFYDDLIKGKIVLINFMFATCTGT